LLNLLLKGGIVVVIVAMGDDGYSNKVRPQKILLAFVRSSCTLCGKHNFTYNLEFVTKPTIRLCKLISVAESSLQQNSSREGVFPDMIPT